MTSQLFTKQKTTKTATQNEKGLQMAIFQLVKGLHYHSPGKKQYISLQVIGFQDSRVKGFGQS